MLFSNDLDEVEYMYLYPPNAKALKWLVDKVASSGSEAAAAHAKTVTSKKLFMFGFLEPFCHGSVQEH